MMMRILGGTGLLLFAGVACSNSHGRGSADGGMGGSAAHEDVGADGGSPASGGAGANGAGGASGRRNGLELAWAVTDAGRDFAVDGGVTDAAIASLPGLPGVVVCVDGRGDIGCATSGPDGTFALEGLPPMTNLVLTFAKDGFIPESSSIQTASTDMRVTTTSVAMFPLQQTTPRGAPHDPESGGAEFLAVSASSTEPSGFGLLEGVTVSLDPPRGEGPDFFVGTQFRRRATATRHGVGFFWNLPPGDYTLTFEHPDYDCSAIQTPLAAFGIPVQGTPNAVRFTVLAGHLVQQLAVFCTAKSVVVATDGG